MKHTHKYFMYKALDQAKIAFYKNEVPVGALIVYDNKIIAKSHNLCESLIDFTAHSEIQAFTCASNYLKNKYLNECILYTTLEPCIMCAGASFWTRIGLIVYGAKDEKRGFSTIKQKILHPSTQVISGIIEDECSSILKEFFLNKRKKE